MRRFVLVAPLVIITLSGGCGGGSPSSPSTPSTPTPTPTTITVYASAYGTVAMESHNDRMANQVAPWPLLDVGHYFLPISQAGGRYRSSFASALKFDLSTQLAERTVTKATLRLYTEQLRNDITSWNPNGPTASMNVQLRASAFVDDWDPASLSWNVWASLGFHSAGEGLAFAPNQQGPVDFDVTTIVRNWASGTWPNRGIKLAADLYPDPGVNSYGATQFYSPSTFDQAIQRPQLIIERQ